MLSQNRNFIATVYILRSYLSTYTHHRIEGKPNGPIPIAATTGLTWSASFLQNQFQRKSYILGV